MQVKRESVRFVRAGFSRSNKIIWAERFYNTDAKFSWWLSTLLDTSGAQIGAYHHQRKRTPRKQSGQASVHCTRAFPGKRTFVISIIFDTIYIVHEESSQMTRDGNSAGGGEEEEGKARRRSEETKSSKVAIVGAQRAGSAENWCILYAK